jgi:biopolymer transport protein ExbD
VRLDILHERVRQKVETLSDKQVYLQGDNTVTLGELMEVFDQLKRANVVNVGIVTRMPGQR